LPTVVGGKHADEILKAQIVVGADERPSDDDAVFCGAVGANRDDRGLVPARPDAVVDAAKWADHLRAARYVDGGHRDSVGYVDARRRAGPGQ
jgi:hypothetical protein